MQKFKMLIILQIISVSFLFAQTFNYPFPYNTNGTPSNMDNFPIPSELSSFMDTYFQDGSAVAESHPELLSDHNEINIFVKETADVWITFIDESAGYKNSLGYYTYQSGSLPTSPSEITHNIIFPNVDDGTWNEGDTPSLAAGDRIFLGQFPAGTVIGWFLVVDGWTGTDVQLNTFGPEDNGNFVEDWIFYSNTNFNPSSLQQNVFLLYPESDPSINTRILGFEDVLRGTTAEGHPYDDKDFDDVLFYITSDAVDAIEETRPSVTVTSPNGGEQYIVNSTQEITWNSNNIDNVTISFSSDNGSNWTLLTSSTPDDGSFTWTPDVISDQCLIRIADVSDNSVVDDSDNLFEIYDGTASIEVISPNGGESYLANTSQTITWNSTEVENVKIEYSFNNGSNWVTLTNSTPSDGSLNWTTPSIISDTYVVRITDVLDNSIIDASNNNFEVYELIGPVGVKYVDYTATSGTQDGLSWENAYLTLQDALSIAQDGDEIWVADGTYYPDEGAGQTGNDRSSVYNITDGIKIYGGFGGLNDGDETAINQRDLSTKHSILSGFIKQNGKTRNSYHVVKFENVSDATILDGFTIQDGNANGSGEDGYGGGIFLMSRDYSNNQCEPVIKNCRIQNNSATSGGGIAHYHNNWEAVNKSIFINCLIQGNNGSSNGDGIYHNAYNVNSGFGVDTKYINCTIIDDIYNTSGGNGNGHCNIEYLNTIIRNNISNNGSGINQTFSYCNVLGGATGTGNIDSDPLFVGGSDYHLQNGSPSINSGNNSHISGWTTIDLEGNSRIQQTTVDMGAYEFTTSTNISFIDGSSFHPVTSQGSSDQAIGRFMLDADNSSATMTSINILLEGVRTGAYNFKLWYSDDDQFDAVSDTKIGNTVGTDPGDNGTITFSPSQGIQSGAGYFFVTCDLTNDATGLIRPYVETTPDISINSGTVITSIIHAPLSAYDTSLPVCLSYFTGQLKNNNVYLQWETGSEVNNRGFSIERRENGGNWIEISSYLRNGNLTGAGNSTEPTNYFFTDTKIVNGAKYEYRLIDVDFSNNENIHDDKIVTIIVENEELAIEKFSIQSIYPNPFNPTANIQYNLPKSSKINISIYDIKGNLIKTLVDKNQSSGDFIVSWDGTNETNTLQSGGLYFAVMTQNSRLASTQKLLFIK